MRCRCNCKARSRHVCGRYKLDSKMNHRELAARTLVQASIVALVVAIILVLLFGAQVWFVVFAGILYAVLLGRMARWLMAKLGLGENWAVGISITLPLLVLGAVAWLVAPDVSSQASELSERLPRAAARLRDDLLAYSWIASLTEQVEKFQDSLPSGARAVDFFARAFASTLGAFGNILLAFVIGVFIAISPRTYVDGLLRLVPPRRRGRTREVLGATESALASWLISKMITMAAIGGMTWVGLWFIGIDLALLLALIAALLSFIPNIGPVVALVPAVLIALVGDLNQVAYVVLLYLAVQTIESYVLTPLLQQQMVDLPPALTISVQVLLGVLGGAMGVILATPLTAAALVMTRMWYVEDILGDRNPP